MNIEITYQNDIKVKQNKIQTQSIWNENNIEMDWIKYKMQRNVNLNEILVKTDMSNPSLDHIKINSHINVRIIVILDEKSNLIVHLNQPKIKFDIILMWN